MSVNGQVTRIGIIVGESSGDILGAGLLAQLRLRYPDCIFEGVGGPRMEALGFRSLYAMERLAVMGLVEPLKRLPELLRMRRNLIQHFIDNPPAVFIGIDAPDFNLTIEEKLRATGIATAHYVSPSVWAWRQGRVKKVARAVDLMLTLFPFEASFYRQHQVEVRFVGHTLADQIPMQADQAQARELLGLTLAANETLVALLPGSRGGEVGYLCPVILAAAKQLAGRHPNLHFAIAAANQQRLEQIQEFLRETPDLPVTVFLKNSREVMAAADLVVMASGTTTLEAMLLKRPMVVTYKMSWLSFAIVKRMVSVGFVGLPNLLAGQALVPELLQDNATAEKIAAAVEDYLQHPEKVDALKAEFTRQHEQLRQNADESAAQAIAELIEKSGAVRS